MNQQTHSNPEAKIGAYLTLMVRNGGSDLFLHSGARPTIKGGFGFKLVDTTLEPGDTECILRSMLPEKRMKEFEEVGDVDFSLNFRGIGRFRGNAFRQRGDVSIVMRHVKGDIPTIDGLGVPQVLKKLVGKKHGLIVVAGATGSGKSTTLAAMIDHRNTNFPGHIITLEDPIEFIHPHKKSMVAQREIGTDTLSFENGMRAAMREAPDVILMGEIRDAVSMEYALKFANTGHLCLSTVHANDAISSIERMLGFFDKDTLEQEAKRLSQNLGAIICQRLVPSTDGGRVAAVEILINTPRVADLISKLDYESLKSTVDQGAGYGMQSFDQALCKLFDKNCIDEGMAIDFAGSKAQVMQHIRYHSERSAFTDISAELSLEDVEEEKSVESSRNVAYTEDGAYLN
jgi:twitching motility protein PilU